MILESRREGRLLELALNRPEKRNALSFELCRALVAAFDEADADPGVGAILLRANGKVFCAGMDLEEIRNAEAPRLSHIHERLFTTGARITKPIVAAVDGPALAGGTGLVANAHIVVAAEGSTFGLTEIRIGLWPFLVYRAIVAAVGERRALEMALSGRIVWVEEALATGLVHHVRPKQEVDGYAREIAAQLAAASATAIRAGMGFVRETRHLEPDAAGVLANRCREEIFRSADFAEGVEAFHQKRPPRWPSLAG